VNEAGMADIAIRPMDFHPVAIFDFHDADLVAYAETANLGCPVCGVNAYERVDSQNKNTGIHCSLLF